MFLQFFLCFLMNVHVNQCQHTDIQKLSNAPQSGDPATALRLKNQKNKIQKTTKKTSKISQTPIKNRSNIDQKSSKIEVWRAPGQVWKRLGPSWAFQGVFECILDRLGGVLEASLKGLGGLLDGLGPRKVANMVPICPPKRSQNQLKIDPKIDQFFSASWNRFWKDFGGFWMRK